MEVYHSSHSNNKMVRYSYSNYQNEYYFYTTQSKLNAMKNLINQCTIVLSMMLMPLIIFSQGNSKDAQKITPLYRETGFTNPEPNDFTPAVIPSKEVADEASANREEAGFEKVFFSNGTLNAMLSRKDCIGIRFYNSLNEAFDKPTVFAIGVIASGSEIAAAAADYCISNGMDMGKDVNYITKETARGCITEFKRTEGRKNYTVYMSATALKGLMNASGAIGINITPGNRIYTESEGKTKDCNTMIFCPAANTGGTITDLGGANTVYIKSLEPCPTLCGNAQNYVVAPE